LLLFALKVILSSTHLVIRAVISLLISDLQICFI